MKNFIAEDEEFNKKEDLRILRTRKLLSDTLFRMMETKSIEEISVTDICEKAMVHRTTFYTHFEDKYHLLKYSLEELKTEIFKSIISEYKSDSVRTVFSRITVLMVGFIEKNLSKIKKIINNNKSEKIIELMKDCIQESVEYLLKSYDGRIEYGVPINVLSAFFTGGLATLAIWWIDNSEKYKKEEIIKYVEAMLDKFGLEKNA